MVELVAKWLNLSLSTVPVSPGSQCCSSMAVDIGQPVELHRILLVVETVGREGGLASVQHQLPSGLVTNTFLISRVFATKHQRKNGWLAQAFLTVQKTLKTQA